MHTYKHTHTHIFTHTYTQTHTQTHTQYGQDEGICFHRPNPRNFIAPDNIPGIDRVTCAKLLGVWLQNDLGTRKHCDYILKICNQRLYLLNLLKKQVLPQLQLQTVFHAILISRLLYAAPAWRGFARAADIDCIQWMLVKAKRWQLVSRDYK